MGDGAFKCSLTLSLVPCLSPLCKFQYSNQPVQYPPHSSTTISVSKRSKFCYHNKVPPKEAYITAVEEASSKLPPMEVDELRSDVSHLLRHPNNHYKNNTNLNLVECRALTELKQKYFKGGTHCRQGGGHGCHGSTRLHQQSTGLTTGHQYLQNSQQGPYR